MTARPIPTVLTVVIPTYNRQHQLSELLESLAAQTLAHDRFEVVLVDDGSADGTAELAGRAYPFAFTYLFQTNQGDAIARNTGAERARGDYLVFLDDDIVLHPDYLEKIITTLSGGRARIVVGREITWLGDSNPALDPVVGDTDPDIQPSIEGVPFVEVCSNNMSIRRDGFFRVGKMENLGFSGSSIWCDVEFSYRAHLEGFEFLRDNRAVCWHRDHVLASLAGRRKRARDAGFRAAVLFKRHPALVRYLPMFADKTPVDLQRDPPGTILRKLLRRVSASPAIVGVIERITAGMPAGLRESRLSRRLQRWLIGAAIFRGYNDGAREIISLSGSGSN